MVVPALGPRVGGLWLVLGLSHRYSWLGAWWAALLAGWPARPVDASGDVDGHGAVVDDWVLGSLVMPMGRLLQVMAMGVAVSGDAYSKGVAGEATGDVVAEGRLLGAPSVGVARDVDGEGASGDAWSDGVSGNALILRVLLVMVLGVCLRMGCRQLFWAWGSTTPGRGPGGRWWSVGSPVLAVLVTSDVGAGPRQTWRRVLMVRVV